jgi:hypothetical protein
MAGEKPKEQTTQEKVANTTGGVMTVVGAGAIAATTLPEIGLHAATGNWLGVGWAVGRAGFQCLSLGSTTATVTEMINPPPTETTSLELAAKHTALRMRIAEDTASEEFTRCLNTHARCTEVNARGIPKRCVSPARRYAMLNESEVSRLIARFNKYKD